MPEVVSHLTYSKDGKYLAVGLGGDWGIRIYKTSDYSLVAEDKEYGDSVYGLDFSKDGRLVVASWNGFIRLYSKDFKLLLRRKAPGGDRPFRVSFSPDGSKIAVGYADTPSVDVLSSETLEKFCSADTSGFKDCALGSVAFSSDGSYLYAGGTCGDPIIIRRWERAGRWGYTDIPVADNTILHILPLKDGGVVFGTWEPSFGIIDRAGRLVLKMAGKIADFRDQLEIFEVSHDGSMVKFGYEPFGKSPVIFDAEYRSFVDKPVNLSKPITRYPDLRITDWQDNYYPKLNGRPLSLEPHEMLRSLAILPDGSSFLLGTSWYLRLFDKNGREIWKAPTPSAAWVFNISGNGKLAIAGFADGTIRWYRMEDGKGLLIFFPHRDRGRWVIWTPNGYYDASPGGEELIGWHINNGKDQEASFYPIGAFKSTFHRPDMIKKVLATLDLDRRKIFPPIVSILSPADGSLVRQRSLTVKYSVRNPSGEPVEAVKVFLDGKLVKTLKGGSGERITGEVELEVPRKDFETSLVAKTKSAVSEPARVRLKGL